MSGTFRILSFLVVAAVAALTTPSVSMGEGVLVCGDRQGDGVTGCALSGNFPSSAQAQQDGVARCQAEGRFNCWVVATFRKSCYAYAFTHGATGWGAGGGPNIASARAAAIATCQRHSPGFACYAHDAACDTVDEQEVQRTQEEQQRQKAETRALEEQRARELAEAERVERERKQLEREAELQRKNEAKERHERRATSDMTFCFQGDSYACNRLLNNPIISEQDRARVSLAFSQLQHLEACEHYDLAACHRISKTPLVDFGPGITVEHDERHKRNTRFNIALQNATAFNRYLEECNTKKRLSCTAALAMPAITAEHQSIIAEMQRALPLYNLDDPKHFMGTIVAIAAVAFIAFLALSRRSPATMHPHSSGVRPLGYGSRLWHRFTRMPSTSAHHATVSNVLPSSSPRDSVTARAALELAYSYLMEIPSETIIKDTDDSARHRSTLALAAKQLDIAQRADPSVTHSLEVPGAPPEVITQQRLRARLLQLEALTWANDNPRREIRLLTQATEIDPTYSSPFYSLGVAHFLARNRAPAIAALERALILEPGNLEIIKQLDRARHMTDAEIAAYKFTNAATGTASAGIKAWNVLRITFLVGTPLVVLLVIASFTGSVGGALSLLVALAVCAPIVRWLLRIMDK